ncbi:hypothetical protein SAMN05443665_103477 [Actinomadura meyerae]|uniref:Uncharacterized protein n=1 Tax=Actinomadura meyerae TaxID=240840 RepID=A0A239N0Y2_9ACTN|nr:hypothetical protein [Actinomadura meyerae]SNT48410.1 hypothetical protein SAMN05443665_103477 [Actinomadura meyerae]
MSEENATIPAKWTIDLGISLSPEAHDRITSAIQRAVLTEIAGIDEAATLSVRLIGPGGRGRIPAPMPEGEGRLPDEFNPEFRPPWLPGPIGIMPIEPDPDPLRDL